VNTGISLISSPVNRGLARPSSRSHLDPARAQSDAGCALLDQLKIPAAIDQFRQALRLQSDLPEARMNLALALLTLGEFEGGWRHFEYPRSGPPRHAGRVWGGEDLTGKDRNEGDANR